MSVASRVPAFLLVGLVLVAAALAVAGYGAPVGIGVIVGLVLGAAVILAFLGLRPPSRIGAALVSMGPPGGVSSQADRDLMERHGRNSMRVAGVDAGALRRVIGVGSGVDAGGARVELVAIEIREDGGIATLVAHTRPPVGFVGHIVEVAVSDDAGTEYVASGQGSGGSSPGASRHEVRFAPAPPEAARVLTVRVDAFSDPFPGRAAGIAGPWEFRVVL